MQHLLRPGQLARRASEVTGRTITTDDIFRMVNAGRVEPHAVAGTLPLFRPQQLNDVVAALTEPPSQAVICTPHNLAAGARR